MAVLDAGYWHTTFWASGFWHEDFWQDGAVGVNRARRPYIPPEYFEKLRRKWEGESKRERERIKITEIYALVQGASAKITGGGVLTVVAKTDTEIEVISDKDINCWAGDMQFSTESRILLNPPSIRYIYPFE